MKFFCESCKKSFPYNPGDDGQLQCPECSAVYNCEPNTLGPGVEIGDFRIIRLLSRGGMGEVFLAEQISLEREVALKVLQSKFVNDQEYIDSLYTEARAAAKLNHPNIVQAYAVGEEDGIFYFAMEYVRGDTFKAILKSKPDGKLEFKQAAQVIRDIAKALEAAWREQKLVHQDIKPDNIMLDGNGFAKLADLGLAKTVASQDEDNEADEVLGTPQYISPEQLTGVPTDVRSDIYSLGATFFQFVTGRFAYVAKTADEIARMHVAGNLEPPKQFNADLPDELNRIIVKMMARYPEERYQLPQELVQDLENYLNNLSTTSSAMPKLKLGGLKMPALGGKAAAPAAGGMAFKTAPAAGAKPAIPPLGGAKPAIPPLGGAKPAVAGVNKSAAAPAAAKPVAAPAINKPAATPAAAAPAPAINKPAAAAPAAAKPAAAVKPEVKPEIKPEVKPEVKPEEKPEDKKMDKKAGKKSSGDDDDMVESGGKGKTVKRIIYALIGLLLVLAAAAVTMCILVEKSVKMGPVQPIAEKVYALYLKYSGKEKPEEKAEPAEAPAAEPAEAAEVPAETEKTEPAEEEQKAAPAEKSVSKADVERELEESGVVKKYMTAFFNGIVGNEGEDMESIAGEIREIAGKNKETADEYEKMVKYFSKELEMLNNIRERVSNIKNVKITGKGTLNSVELGTGKIIYTLRSGLTLTDNFFSLNQRDKERIARGIFRRMPRVMSRNAVFYFTLLNGRLGGEAPVMWNKYRKYMPASLPRKKK